MPAQVESWAAFMTAVLLTCCDPLRTRRPAPHFSAAAEAAKALGSDVAPIDHDALIRGDAEGAVDGVPRGIGPLCYRGRMLPSDSYTRLADALAERDSALATDALRYRRAHELPGWYETFATVTPRSVWLPTEPERTIPAARLAALAASLGPGPVVAKDYVKSRKHKAHGLGVTLRQRNQLVQAAEQASAWLTDRQRSQVQEWWNAPKLAPAPRAPQPPRGRSPRFPASRSKPFNGASLADAVRDVLEHAARLGKTVPLTDLCDQVKGLGELTDFDQLQVLRLVRPTARPRSAKPQCSAQLTAEDGTMHQLYRQLADHHPPRHADGPWTDTVKILHDHYRTP